MARGTGFAQALSDYLITHFKDDLARLVVFVPTSRVAARVRAALAADIEGVLPAVLPLKGNGELADLLGLPYGRAAHGALVKLEMSRFLVSRARSEDSDEEQGTALTGERLQRRVEGLYTTLDRLALYGVSVEDLRRTVPHQMVGLWELQAETLLAVAAHMAHWLARRGEAWPGEIERRVLEAAAARLADEACDCVPVVAGILDGVPAAHAVMRAAAARGRVIVPELGAVTAELGSQVVRVSGSQDEDIVRLSLGASEVRTLVAETEWDEAWLAALAVRRAKAENGQARVAVVSADRNLLRRVSALLQRWGMVVPVRGEMCLDHTPESRRLLALHDWGMRGGKITDWLNALEGVEASEAVMQAMAPLSESDAWLDAEMWHVVLRMVLGMAPAPVSEVSEGVLLLGPLDARLMDFDNVIVAGATEGVWPAASGETWLSEPHLRALGLPDVQRKAQLAGTEFESAVMGGHGSVLVLRSRTVEGRDAVASRFWEGSQVLRVSGSQDGELLQALEALRQGEDGLAAEGRLGRFEPTGDLWPKTWSASFIEAMLACPYKALGERILKLAPPEPLAEGADGAMADARMAGLLAHRWLERIGSQDLRISGSQDVDALVRKLLEIGEFELRHESAVIRAIWRAKFAKLAPALVARWQADAREVADVEQRMAQAVGPVKVAATLDRVEVIGSQGGSGGKVIIDFKTSTPPSWADVAAGVKPQLAIEAWLLAAAGEVVADVEYWQLRGYGPNPVAVTRPAGKYRLEDIVAPVAEGLEKLVATYHAGAAFDAVPDMAGGGLMATGHCTRCELAGVCRRKAQGARNVERGI